VGNGRYVSSAIQHGPDPSHRVRVAVMRHEWQSITFLHWPYEPAVVQRLLPPGLEVETRHDAAWVGLVPFRITIRGPFGPAPPWLNAIPETNVRTYVIGPDGRPGIWFFSLDIASPDAVAGARAAWGLPYHWSRMTVVESGREITYRSQRRNGSGTVSLAHVRVGELLPPNDIGEFEHYLTARFGLWSRPYGALAFTPASHPRWRLASASVEVLDDELVMAAGLPAPTGEPLVHFSVGVPVRIGLPRLFLRNMRREGEHQAEEVPWEGAVMSENAPEAGEQPEQWQEHDHEATVHNHRHYHVTHNHNEMTGGFEHLSSAHEHEHNHAALHHSHVPHRDFEHEHQGEAHIHDHEAPTSSQESH
jgi:uncharacterized protein YqjF (DUF2071 family)